MMPREAATNTVAGSGWEAVVKAKGRGGEFAAQRLQIPRSYDRLTTTV